MATFKNLPNLYNLPSVAPQQAEEDPQGDMARGFKTAMMQIPQTAGGALALAGDALGADGLRDYGMGVYQKNSDKIAALSKDSDSLSNVIEGDASAADWLQYAAGYTGGQALTAVATGGLGGMIGSQLAKRGIREVVARGAQSAAAKQVAGKVAATGAKVGAGTALLGTNLMQEAGSIYPEAREEAQAQGRELDGGDLARVGLSAAGAAAVDTAMDAVMLGRMMKGGRRAGEGMARAAVREVPAAMGREAVTEGIQTGIERYGAGKELSTADAIREYVDSIGMGAVGGGLGGGASVLNTQKVQESGPLTRAVNAGIDEQIKLLANDPDPLVAFPDGSVGTKTDLHMYLRQFSDPQERLEKERELMGRDPKTGKRPEPVPEPEPVMANSPEAEQQYLKAWTDAHDPVNLDYAKALIDAPGAKGKDLMIVPHPKGKGYTVVPSRWITLDTQARASALQKGEEAMLPSPDREMPDGRMIVDAEGGSAPETYGDATRAEQGRQKLAAEAQRREELGTPVPHGTKAVPKPAKPILSPSGTPFKSKRAAINAQRAQNLGESHDIQEVEGGFVLQPKRVLEPDLIDRAAHEAATSPQNDLPEPTDAQKSANNYKMGHIKVQGLDISVENPRGSTRRGKRPDGSTWEHQMSDHYGYIKRTEGADGEQVDVYVGPKPDAERVFVVDQLNQEDGSFDEHKAMLGYGSQRAAITAYKSNFDKGWKVGHVKSMTMVEFKDWLKNGDTKQPASETKQAETVTQSEKSETPAVVNESFTTRADANAAMLKAAEDTGRVHEVVESEDGTFAVQPVAENKDTSSEAAPAEPAQDGKAGTPGTGNAETAPEPEKSTITPDGKKAKSVRMTPLAHPGLDNQDIRAELELMADEAGWEQVGGRMIREVADDPNSRVVGRTPWIPKQQWYADLPERLNEADTVRAVVKALGGKPMSAREKRVISNMLDFAQTRIQEMTNYYEDKVSHEADYMDAIEALDALPDRDLDVLIEGGSTDTAEMMRALGFTEEEIAHEIQGQGNQGGQGDVQAAAGTAPQGDQRGGDQTRPDDQQDNQRGAQVAQKRDAYTKDLFGIQLPDVGRVDAGSARQSVAADTGDMDSADAVPKGSRFGSRTKLVTENKRKLGAAKVVSMDDAANALAYLSRGAVERLDALVTDKNGKPLAVVGAFKGALTQASVYPATIVGEAFRIKGAANIWFAHNHPSGNEELSNADRMLYKALREVFRGSDIEPRGLFAIAGGTDATRAWQLTDGDDTYSGETSETGETTDTPVVERQYAETGLIGTPVTSPATAKKTAAEIADGKSGILMLDVKNRPIAFVPIDVAMPMRTNGRMDAIYRAISTANAAAAMVVTDGSINNEGVRNLGALMRGVDVRVLDVMDTSGDVVKSWAEQGLEMAAPAFFNVNDLGKASVPSTAATFDQSLYDDIGTGKSSKDILSRIANESGNALNREIAQALLDAGINPKVTQETADGKRFTVGNAPQGYAFAAAYSPKTDTVMLFRPEEAERNALHEFVHAGSFKALRKNGPASVGMKQLYKHVQQSGKAEGMYGMSNFDEFTAEALSNPEFQDALRSITAMPEGSKFENVWQWFVDLVRRALGLPTKYSNALDQALRYGRGLMLENGGDAKQDAVLGNTIEQTKTAAFRKWFGDSKVVDADGKPLIVYHGTTENFSAFDPDRTIEGGFFFSTDQSEASRFGDVMPVYLSLSNPLEVDGKTIPVEHELEDIEAIIRNAKKGDHDGVLIRGFRDMKDDPTDTYIAFRPEQIKSATGNNGNFDQNEPSILGNINRDTAQAISNGIKSVSMTDLPHKAGNRLKDFRGLGLQALGRRQILDIYRDDFKPEGKPSILAEYNELAQRMDADKNEAGAQADGIADRWGKLSDERQLAELMHDATLAQIDPEKDYQPGDNRGQWTGLRNRYNALSADAKAIYKEARNSYTDHWMKVRAEIKDRIQRSMPESPRRAKMLERMDDEFFKKIKGVYFPLARFGDYLVTVKGADGKTESVNFAETLNEAEKLRAELVKKFPKDQGHVVGKVQKRREFNAARDAVGRGFLQELFGLLDQSGVADELQDSINQLYLSSLPDLSWAKHGIHRKGTPGFSQDARRAFAQNMFHGARYLAKLKYADRMADTLTDMQDFVDSKAGDDAYDSVAAQQVVDEMNKRHEAYMNPKTSPLSTTLTSLGFIFYLGLSPASAVVNLSQTPLVTLPMLAAKYGYGKASAALLAASKQAAGNKNDISKALAGDELRAFNEAVKSGVIDVSMAHDLAGIASGEDTKTHAKLRPVMKWASFLFHHGEKFNRQATLIAAYRLAREDGQDHDAAYESAVKMTYDSHFDYSSGNRPRVMQGDVARVALLFKQYSQNMVYSLARNATLAARGDRQALKVLSGLLLSHAMAAGVLGLPVVGTLLSIASALGSDDDEPWDAKVALRNALADALGEKPAEVLVHGLSRLTPFDISGRVGLDKLLLPDIQEGLEGARAVESWMSAALGPIAGIGINTAKGLENIAEGQMVRGLESMVPAALRGPLKALRYNTEGVKDKTGIVVMEDTSALEELGQALGFSPSRVREANEGKSAVYQADRRLLDRRQALMTQWAHARMAGDAEGAAEVQESIKRFNEKNPSRKITPLNLNQSLRNRQRRIEQAEQGVYLPSKRRDVQDVGRFATVE